MHWKMLDALTPKFGPEFCAPNFNMNGCTYKYCFIIRTSEKMDFGAMRIIEKHIRAKRVFENLVDMIFFDGCPS